MELSSCCGSDVQRLLRTIIIITKENGAEHDLFPTFGFVFGTDFERLIKSHCERSQKFRLALPGGTDIQSTTNAVKINGIAFSRAHSHTNRFFLRFSFCLAN